jgi:hypothetical protein
MFRTKMRVAIGHIGLALREPEAFAQNWHTALATYHWSVFAALIATAIAGTTIYGLTMGLLESPARMLVCALACTVAAGIGWGLPLPALYILNSASGSNLRASTMLLAALVTTSWGGLAMIASVPISIFFSAAIPVPWFVLLVHLTVFAGVGVAMVDTFARVMARLEPARGRMPAIWLLLVGAIGAELFYAFGLFNFLAITQSPLWTIPS